MNYRQRDKQTNKQTNKQTKVSVVVEATNCIHHIGFQDLTAVTKTNDIFWDAVDSGRIRISCYLPLLHDIKNGIGMFHETVCKLVDYTGSYPRKQNS
jgi:hypothetical protein